VRELLHLGRGARERDLVAAALGELDRDEMALARAVLRPDDEVRHALLDRIDHEVGELADDLVGAADRSAELQSHHAMIESRGAPAITRTG
jgi:hypothetical protein